MLVLCVLRGEARNTNFISLWFDPTVAGTHDCHTLVEPANHYTIGVVYIIIEEYYFK